MELAPGSCPVGGGAVVLVALNLTRALGLFRPMVGNKQIKTQL